MEEILSKSIALVNKGKKRLEKKANPFTDLEELHFELTYRCNCNCIMCDINVRQKKTDKNINKELTLEEIKRFILDSKYVKKIKMIILSGGEPFLRKDLVDLAIFLAEYFPLSTIGILTNLFDTEVIYSSTKRIIERVPPSRIFLGTSLDGLGSKHDHIRGVKGAFDRFVKGVDIIKENFPDISLAVNFTLTTENYKELIPAFEFSRKKDLDFSAQFAIPWDGSRHFIWEKSQLDEIKISIRHIMQTLVDDYRAKGSLLPFNDTLNTGLLAQLYYWNGLIDYQKHPHREFKRCFAGAKYAMFNPIGDLYFCPKLKDMIVGNIRELSFDHLWTSANASKIRRYIDSGSCHCWLNCTIFPNVGEALQKGLSLPQRRLVSFGHYFSRKGSKFLQLFKR
jgi:MoaA/NifB/PqqE/SkfB family radical SAM enzyme